MKSNFFAFYKPKLGYNPVDIDILLHIWIITGITTFKQNAEIAETDFFNL